MATPDVDAIVGEEEFDEFLGGQVFSEDTMLAPDSWQRMSKPARQHALDRILDHLRSKTPPIYYSDLDDPTELKIAVMYGAAEHIYQLAMSTSQGGDIFAKQRELWEKKFDDKIAGITLTLNTGFRVGMQGIQVSRR